MNSRKSRFKENFEVDEHSGAYVMTSLGCFDRHNLTRAEQEMTPAESKARSFGYSSRAQWADSKLTEMVGLLQRQRIPLIEDTLEMYVQNNLDLLIERHEITAKDISDIIQILIERS